jgi:Pentapeptide repeats (9 copies)
MNNEQSIALYEQGKDAWNEWAEEMIAENKRLGQIDGWTRQKSNKMYQNTLTNFTAFNFYTDVDFSGFIFPGPTYFSRAVFEKDATFDSTVFKGDVFFEDAKFEQDMWCEEAIFKNNVLAKNTYFKKSAWFERTIFNRSANFGSAKFDGLTSFLEAKFQQGSSFGGITANMGFLLEQAQFSRLPDFRQAHFKEAPNLDSIVIHQSPSQDSETAAKYRILKKLAIQGHDHEQELNFFAGELEAKGSFIGKLYGWVSDYGRSLSSPFFGWVVTMLYSAMGYHSLSLLNESNNKVFQLETCSKTLNAFELSLRKGLLALGWEKSSRLDQIYSCLYGKAEPAVSFAVSMGGLVQTVLSAVFIFLFLLALRNRFRIK